MTKALYSAGSSIFVLVILTSCGPADSTLNWIQERGYKWAELEITPSRKIGFEQLAASETRITFSNHITKSQIDSNRVLLNGSGVAVGDVDSDGLADLYFCRINGPNVLYKNLGNFKFEDITDSLGVSCPNQFSSGTTLADIDGDADLDLLVTSIGGPNTCFFNDGTGRFTKHESAVISSNTGASSMALADIDADGDLDLYVVNYKKLSAKDIFSEGELMFEQIVERDGDSYGIAAKYKEHYDLEIRGDWVLWLETGEPDMLFLNDGKGHFSRVPFNEGRFMNENGDAVAELKDWGLMARFQDMDGDGDPDLYVCNDFESPDRIWINDGQGHFQPISKLAIRKTSNSAMSVDFSDIDRDEDLDFLVVDMLSPQHIRRMRQKTTMVPIAHGIGEIDNRPQYMQNTLFLNRGDNTYAEISQFSNLQASDWSWSNLFLDVDLDGFEDVLVATGHYYDAQDYDTIKKAEARKKMDGMMITHRDMQSDMPPLNTIFMYPRLELPNIAFRNRGNLTFEEVAKKWGFASEDISHGMALGDLDNDGDLDIVINRLDAPAGIYRNVSPAPRIAVRLRGLLSNTQGIGAKIRVLGGPLPQSKEVASGGAYLSGSDPLYVFAADEAKTFTIEVKWRNGKISRINDVTANRIYEIHESNFQSVNELRPSPEDSLETFFEDVSYFIDHQHHEDPFDDFGRQPLLPKRLSQLGPGVTWYDIDADGYEDLIITSGKGGQLATFLNDSKNGFSQIKTSLALKQVEGDQTTALAWTKRDGTRALVIGYSNFENTKPSQSIISINDFKNSQFPSNERIVVGESSIGPMAMADYDNDGDLDLFVGGRFMPGCYPAPASSILYRNQDGYFEIDSLNTEEFSKLGMVSGAVFSDLDNDGDQDLVLAIEWGQVMTFRNSKGSFSNVTEESGLRDYYGWWQGITTGDLNADGRLDVVATNWGLNHKYQARYDDDYPLLVFYGDFDNNGSLDLVEAYTHRWTKTLLPERNFASMRRAIPSIAMWIFDANKYSRSSVQEILGPEFKKASRLSVNTLRHMVFLNRGNEFEAVEMPREAQLSPAFHVGVADYDGDGHEDVFISQNFFAMEVETPRLDAGRGLWLRGDGTGNLQPVPGQESGVMVYGEQRGAALGDFDQDGRVDLALSQNGAKTKLYRNRKAKPGLRVRLSGAVGNPDGVGAVIRLIHGDTYGPAREIHAGSGYWSQDSVVQVMGYSRPATGVWVKWPGGKTTVVDLKGDESEVVIAYSGELIKGTGTK